MVCGMKGGLVGGHVVVKVLGGEGLEGELEGVVVVRGGELEKVWWLWVV